MKQQHSPVYVKRSILPSFNVNSIQSKATLLLIALVLLTLASYLLVFYSTNQLARHHTWTEIARRNELSVQQMVYWTEKVAAGETQLNKKLEQETIAFQNRLDILKYGGEVYITQKRLKVPPIKGEAQNKLSEVEILWNNYKKQIDVLITQEATVPAIDSSYNELGIIEYSIRKVPNRERQAAIVYIRDNSFNLLKQSAELSDILAASYYDTKSRTTQNLIIAFLIYVGLFIITYIQFKNTLINPIRRIAEAAERLAQGDVNIHLRIKQKDEVGQLAQSINTLSSNLHKTAEFADKIGHYQFDIHFEARSEKDLLGKALLEMRDNLKRIDEEAKLREWHNRGIAIFNELSRMEFKEIEEFGYRVVYELIRYLDIVHGAFYVVEEETTGRRHIRMAACYAYDRRRFDDVHFEIEEGIIGQVVYEKDKVILRDLPEGYLQISSGLGESNPKMLLAVPLKTEQAVFGVLELASFREFQAHEIAFVEEVAETVAMSIASVQIAEQTRKLLKEAQETAQQMRAQEEEMRQNMEELAATQEALAKREKEQREVIERLRNEYESRLESIYKREKHLKNQLQEAQQEMQTLRVKVAELERQRDELRRVIHQLRQDDKLARQALKVKDEEIAELKAKIEEMKKKKG
ncbi:HAMP domain-containing protein [Thermonema lapsum]|uniref:HAMP domain-containing protein n=1 Tax=Thermonema lapsum TaxID=28195 RepID=A0A846MT28_9BACT|nr:HAMP domain-containing protein [Thermonema lapsum]NIK74723.1 HAMP domain-containing protein [Thermonema lapsum]